MSAAPDPTPTPDEALSALVTPEGRRDPQRWYESLRTHGGLVRVRPGLVVAVGHAECLAALREPRLLVQDARSHDRRHPGWREHSSLRGFTRSMLYANAPDHPRMRRSVMGSFTARRMLALEPAVAAMTDRLLDRMAVLGAAGRPVDFMAEFAFRLPVAVISAVLGVPERDQEWFRDVAADVTVALEGITDLSRLERADGAMDELDLYFTDLVARRRQRPRADLLSALATDEDGTLDHDELVGNLVLLLVAGFDTTTHLLGTALSVLLERPDLAHRLRTDEAVAPAFVEEVLRIAPPVQATSRWAGTDLELLGTPLTAGTKVLLHLGAANRDPIRFPDPDRLDLDRDDNRPLSFGGGLHMCLGATLARLEGRLALPRLLRRFPGIAAAGGAVHRDRLVVPGLVTLPVLLDGSASYAA